MLSALKRFDGAALTYEKLLGVHPAHPYVRGGLAFSRLQACDWRRLAQDRADIATGLKAGKRMIKPLINARLSSSPADQLLCARICADDCPASPNPLWRGELYRHDRIHVAYISADFRDHATAWLAAGLFEHHDRSCFETIAISSLMDEGSEMQARLKNAFDHFVDAQRQTDSEVAGLLRRMEVDIAVDLTGFTSGYRPGILALRPAPVQVNFLGCPGTTGSPYIDYIVADRIVIPKEHQAFYTEKIATLPDTYQCNDSKRRIAEITPSRAEAGLPAKGFVFCCFNNASKIMPEILLKDVDGSVLWLLENNPRAIDAKRLIFAPHLKLADHLARHRLADLFLDTLPYGAHTTASDSLWAGLPVITCMGTTFAGRVAASLLHAVGMPELIAHALEDYTKLARKLAGDQAELAAIRNEAYAQS